MKGRKEKPFCSIGIRRSMRFLAVPRRRSCWIACKSGRNRHQIRIGWHKPRTWRASCIGWPMKASRKIMKWWENRAPAPCTSKPPSRGPTRPMWSSEPSRQFPRPITRWHRLGAEEPRNRETALCGGSQRRDENFRLGDRRGPRRLCRPPRRQEATGRGFVRFVGRCKADPRVLDRSGSIPALPGTAREGRPSSELRATGELTIPA